MLWTMQYSIHWMFTLILPRKVNRSRRLWVRRLANTGSMIAIRPWVDLAPLLALDLLHHELGEIDPIGPEGTIKVLAHGHCL